MFPERQVLLRSNGRVRFVTLSGRTQTILTLAGVAAAVWLGFSSVNTITHWRTVDRYEQQLEQVRADYERLNVQFTTTRAEVDATTELLRFQQQQLGGSAPLPPQSGNRLIMSPVALDNPPLLSRLAPPPQAAGPGGLEPQASSNAPGRTMPGGAADGSDPAGITVLEAVMSQLSSEAQVTSQSEWHLDRASAQQRSMAVALEEHTDREIRKLEIILAGTNALDPGMVRDGLGGPLRAMALAGGHRRHGRHGDLERQLHRISANLQRLAGLRSLIRQTPLAAPLDNYLVTSGFGPRTDPFTRRLARHEGIDLIAPAGSTVRATAPGDVVRAGARGAYGLVVSLDHGNGLITRYGHLRRILVKTGQKVRQGDAIGEVGSSGRSTGPHLHYEIRINGRAHDPWPFLKSGYHVFAQQGQ